MDTAHLVRMLLSWHYGQALSDMRFIWMNFMRLIYRVFSLPDLLRTLFSPWRRMTEPYSKRPGVFDPGQIAAALVVNTMMRIVGLFVRVIFIALSLALFTIVIVLGLFIFLLWIFMPLVLLGSFGFGLALLLL
ncbi:MAG TPA: hypothetical protein VFM02_02580 [Candidatus Paceibacterota bacterium]|nr:hypothetical protein [Candidatus Paceibacterota bacterium]